MVKQLQQQHAHVKKQRRKKKASRNAIKEIKNEQKKTTLVIPQAPIHRLINEIAKNFRADLRFKSDAYVALHTAAEHYLITMMQRSNKAAIHNKRETIQVRDLKLALELSKE